MGWDSPAPPPPTQVPVSGCNAADTTLIQQQVQQACANINVITDADLRNCISQKMCSNPFNGAIQCGNGDCNDPSVLGFDTWTMFLWWKIGADSTIHLCMSNIRNSGLQNRIWQILLHEFAHSCCWDHGQGKGVPGNDGTLG